MSRGNTAIRTFPPASDVTLPADVAMERTLLGSCLFNRVFFREMALMDTDDFTGEHERRLFVALASMADKGQPIDSLTVASELSARKELEALGGAWFIEELQTGAVARTSVAHYVSTLRHLAGRRAAMHKAEAILLEAEAGGDLGTIADHFTEGAVQTGCYCRSEIESWRDIFHSFDEFVNAPPLQFAVDGVVQVGGIGIIAGLAGHGKTLMMLALAEAMLSGAPLFDHFEVHQKSERLIYLVPESTLAPFWARLKMFHLEEYVKSGQLLVRTLSKDKQIALSDQRILQAAYGADIFLDTLVRFFEGAENDADSAKAFAEMLFKLLGAGAHTITASHHSPKSFENADRMTLENALRGSGDIGAMLSTAWGIRQVDPSTNRIYVQNLKARDFAPCAPFLIEGRPHLDEVGKFKLIEAPGSAGDLRDYLTDRRGGAPVTLHKGEKLQRTLEMHANGSSVRNIAKTVGVAKSTIQRWIDDYEQRMSRPCPGGTV